MAPPAGLMPQGRRRCSALLVVTTAVVIASRVTVVLRRPNSRLGSPCWGASPRAVFSTLRYFEPGACVEYPPASSDRHLTVFLDAGHGGLDPGGVERPSRARPFTKPTRHSQSSSTR